MCSGSTPGIPQLKCVWVCAFMHARTRPHTHTHTCARAHAHMHNVPVYWFLYLHKCIWVWRMDGMITDRENRNTWIKMCCSAICPLQILHRLLWSCFWTPSKKPAAICLSYAMPLTMHFNPITTKQNWKQWFIYKILKNIPFWFSSLL